MNNHRQSQQSPSATAPEDDNTATEFYQAVDEHAEPDDPFTDNLSNELTAAAAKTWRNRATIALAALVLVTIGFAGGALAKGHTGSTSTSTAARAGGPGAAGGFGGPRTGANQFGAGGSAAGRSAPGGAASASSATSQTGTIKQIDGTTIYVQLTSGDIVTVRTSDATKISLGSPVTVSSLQTGQKVTISGSTSNGTVTATTVTASK